MEPNPTTEPPFPPETDELLIADIAVDVAYLDERGGVFSYGVPDDLRDLLKVGQVVWVPLRRQRVLGVVVGLHGDVPEFPLRPIAALFDPPMVLGEDRLDLALWIARTTATSIHAATALMLPPSTAQQRIERLRIADQPPPVPEDLPKRHRQLLELILARGMVNSDIAAKQVGVAFPAILWDLEDRGLVTREVETSERRTIDPTLEVVRLAQPDAVISRSAKQAAIVSYLLQRRRTAPEPDHLWVLSNEIVERTGTDRPTIAALAKKGVIEVKRVMPDQLPPETDNAPMLTVAQATAWACVETSLKDRDATPTLLHGVTGSGKTEVYLRATAWCLRQRRAAIVLVPEIGLASQVVRRFERRFPGRVAILHSALTATERYTQWMRIRSGELPVVVGPRSALFAPVGDLGLIVIDEEHESAYKQDSEPRYHARRVAEEIARRAGAALVLGSATPAVETMWRCDQGDATRVPLPDRVPSAVSTSAVPEPARMPVVEIIDMRLELHRGNAHLFSERLQLALTETLVSGEQSLVLLNRRGQSTVVMCTDCGETVRCPQCDIPLVYHADRRLLLCHRCDHRRSPIQQCENCGSPLNYFGAGTQRIESEVRRLVPEARVSRWDQDSVRQRGSHERLLKQVERHEIDIVVGTQMIAKGLDLPLVRTVGVIQADGMLQLPDFRSSERTFQLLTQVAGRAGRRGQGGTVIFQTMTPDHYVIRAASRHDYMAFYREELAFRDTHGYPPFARFIRFVFRHAKEETCAADGQEYVRSLARHLRQVEARADLLGPTPAFASRVRGEYQWQIILRADPEDFSRVLDGLPTRPGWSIDVDPQSMM